MAEEKQYYQNVTGTDPATGQMRPYFQIYSTDNTPRGKDEFNAAFQIYSDTGRTPPGYTVLPAGGSQSQLRMGFEEGVASPARRLEQMAATPLPSTLVEPGYTGAGRAIAQAVDYPYRYGIKPAAEIARSTLVQPLLRSMQTPETAGALAGNVMGIAASGGLSTLPAMGVQALTTGLGYQGANLVADSHKSIGQAFAEAGLAAASRGAMGLLQWATGSGMDQRVAEKTSGELLDLFKQEYPHLAGMPELTNYAMDQNPKMLQRATQILIKGMRESAIKVVDNVDDSIAAALPTRMSVGDQNTYRAGIRALQKATGEYIDSANDVKAFAAAKDSVLAAVDKLETFVNDTYKNDPAVSTAVGKAFDNYTDSLSKQMGPAYVVRAAEKSGQASGWNNQAFMNEVQDYYRANPGSALERAGEIASRGTYRNIMPRFNVGIPFTGTSVPVGPLGRVYGDKAVNVTLPIGLGTVGGTSAMESFTGARGKQE